jgi:hypothetical protein
LALVRQAFPRTFWRENFRRNEVLADSGVSNSAFFILHHLGVGACMARRRRRGKSPQSKRVARTPDPGVAEMTFTWQRHRSIHGEVGFDLKGLAGWVNPTAGILPQKDLPFAIDRR